MNIAFHTGKTAMIAQAQALNVYGNNIANINTYGYQTVRPSFADCLYSTQRAYQISSRVVTTSDEFTRLANNLR